MVENVDMGTPAPGPPAFDRALAWVGTLVGDVLRSPLVAWLPRHTARRGPGVYIRAGAMQPHFDPPTPTWLPPPGDLRRLTAHSPILHSDDCDELLDVTRLILEMAGWHVVSHRSAQATLDTCQRLPVSLVITDVTKPGMDGFEMVRRLREHPTTASIPVMFVTARSMACDVALGRQLGAVDYLTKPVLAGELLAAVEDALCRFGNWHHP